MPASALERLTADVLALPVDQRETLAHQLLDSVEHGDDTPLSPEWEAEIGRRIQEIDDGAETFAAEDVFAEMLRECA